MCFLERKYSPGSAIDWYYQYQTMYLRLMAENQFQEKETGTTPTIEEPASGFVVAEKIQNCQPLTEVNSNQVTAVSREYSCSRCGNVYTRPHSLNRHIKFECGVEPQFECPICHKKSKHKHNLVLHMRTHQKLWNFSMSVRVTWGKRVHSQFSQVSYLIMRFRDFIETEKFS